MDLENKGSHSRGGVEGRFQGGNIRLPVRLVNRDLLTNKKSKTSNGGRAFWSSKPAKRGILLS